MGGGLFLQKVEELSCLLEVSRQELSDALAELEQLKFELEKTQIRSKSGKLIFQLILQFLYANKWSHLRLFTFLWTEPHSANWCFMSSKYSVGAIQQQNLCSVKS